MLDKKIQLTRAVRLLIALSNKPKFFGTVEIQFHDSIPTYTKWHQGRRIEELNDSDLAAIDCADEILKDAR